MDPLSLSLGIAGVLPVVASVIRLAKNYHDDVKSARESIALLITELTLLESALKSLDAFLESPDGRDATRDLSLDKTSVLRTCSVACSTKLKVLESKLGKAEAAGAVRRLMWPLDERDHKKTIKELRDLTLWIQFSLSVDNIRILCGAYDQLTRLMYQQVEQLQSLAEVHETTAKLLQTAVENHVSQVSEQQESAYRKTVLEWISAARHDERHRASQAVRLQNTGGWLLQTPQFLSWVTGSPNILWCHGGPGTGKTVLTSAVIDHLLGLSENSRSVVGYLYFDYKNHDSQLAVAMLLSLVRQLVEAQATLPDSIAAAFESHQRSQQSLSIDDARQLLSSVVSSSNDTKFYLAIDAIDECLPAQRRVLLDALSEMARSKYISILITGRPHVDGDVERFFPTCPRLEIFAHEEDLRRYIDRELEITDAFDIIDDEFGEDIAKRLVTVSRGMFLLAVLHLRTLLDLTSVGAMQDALDSLTESLSEAYRTTISRIQQLPGSRSELGMAVLQWVCFAREPLTADGMLDILCIKPGQTSRNTRYRPPLKVLLECCQGLIVIEPETRFLRPAHYTVQEHLMNHELTLFPRRDLDMAQKCLAYLIFQDFSSGPARSGSDLESRIKEYPFLSYASRQWHIHISSVVDDMEIKSLLWKFLESNMSRAVAKQTRAFASGFVRRYYQDVECLSHTALHMACQGGLASIVRQLLDDGNPHHAQVEDINLQTHIGSTPIIMAAAQGSVEISRLLLRHGADPFIENAYGNALHCAAESGKSGTIRVLVEHGMPPGPHPRYHKLPIRCTLDRDCAGALETLLDLGASIEDTMSEESQRCVPQQDSEGCGKCRTCHGVNFLALAVIHNAGNVIRLLAKRKLVDINARIADGASPLHLARVGECFEAARVLEELGAEDRGPDLGLAEY